MTTRAIAKLGHAHLNDHAHCLEVRLLTVVGRDGGPWAIGLRRAALGVGGAGPLSGGLLWFDSVA